ncbi:MAG: sigma-70 family RNA polymerase sigma factor [Vicinamibacterales bacterium]
MADSRAKLAGATTPEQRMAAANEQSSALARLLVVVENYPDLKSNQTFARLMDELAGTENRLAVERQRYNERVQETTPSGGRSPRTSPPGSSGSRNTRCSRPRRREGRSQGRFHEALALAFRLPAGGPPGPPVPTLLPGTPSNLMPVDDVVLAASGDTAAFERVYHAYVPRVHGLARRMAGPEAADELTQDVFVRVWQKLATFRGESSFGTWLHRLAVNVIVERFRTLGTARRRFFDDGESRLEVVHAPARSRPDLGMDLDAAIDELPHGARTVFVLHDVEGFRHDEIATMLGVSTGTTKSQLHRARQLLRAELTAKV